MRNMSFMLTTEQVRNGTKTVTRRNGWKFLKPGDRVMACVKCQGIPKGQKIEKIRPIEIVSVTREPLTAIYNHRGDCEKEGFPEMSPFEFVNFYCNHNNCDPRDEVSRIEYKYI